MPTYQPIQLKLACENEDVGIGPIAAISTRESITPAAQIFFYLLGKSCLNFLMKKTAAKLDFWLFVNLLILGSLPGCSRGFESAVQLPPTVPTVNSGSYGNGQIQFTGPGMNAVAKATLSQGGTTIPTTIVSATANTLILAATGMGEVIRSALPMNLVLTSSAGAMVTGTFTINLSGTMLTNFSSTGITDLATATVMTLSAANNVGIGTTNPSTPLQVTSGGATVFRVSSTAGAFTGLDISQTATGSGTIKLWDAQPLAFYTSGAEQMRIDPTGKVGIGATIPNSLLQVAGPIATAVTAAVNGYTLLATDSVVIGTPAGATAYTLPTPVGITGRQYTIKNLSTFTITVTPAAGLIWHTTAGAASYSLLTGTTVTVVSNGTDWYIINIS